MEFNIKTDMLALIVQMIGEMGADTIRFRVTGNVMRIMYPRPDGMEACMGTITDDSPEEREA